MKNNDNPITDIWYYTNEIMKKNEEKEIFYFKFKNYKVPLRIQLHFQEEKFYKCTADYKIDIGKSIVNNKIRNFKRLELFEIEFDKKYKSYFEYILNLEERRIMFYNKTSEKLFPLLLENLEKIIKGENYE